MTNRTDLSCPACKEPMEKGFVLEVSHHRRSVTEWVKGPPVKGFFGDLKIDKEKKRAIVSYRCTRCGLLMNYAS